jgi:hypothetical protein
VVVLVCTGRQPFHFLSGAPEKSKNHAAGAGPIMISAVLTLVLHSNAVLISHRLLIDTLVDAPREIRDIVLVWVTK